MRKYFIAATLLATIGLWSCGNQTDRATTNPEQEVLAITGTPYFVNLEESHLTWKVGHKGGVNPRFGTLALASGQISFHDGHLEAGEYVIDMNSIKVDRASVDQDEDVEKLANHLKDPDFFDVDQYPTVEFKITKVEELDPTHHAANMEHANAMISGNLNILGKPVNITFPAHIQIEEERALINAHFIADRSEWGLTYGTKDKETGAALNPVDWMISKDMEIGIHLVAEKKKN